jgi:Glycosyltransferase
MTAPLRILSIATLFPDAARPNFGLFVEKSLRALAAQPGAELTIVAPVGLPPFPASLHRRYRALRTLPLKEKWGGLTVHRPRFALIPRYGRAPQPGADRACSARGGARPGVRCRRCAILLPRRPRRHARRSGARPALFVSRRAAPTSAISAMTRRAGRSSLPQPGAPLDFSPFRMRCGATWRRSASTLPRSRSTIPVSIRRSFRQATAPLHVPRSAWARLRQSQPSARSFRAKGQALVIEALAELPGVHYWLAGSGEEEGRYRALAERLGVADRVHLMGPLAQSDLPQLYRAADAVVMPSASEGLANAWVEALACGTPIVISEAGGAAELVTSPKAGRIVERTPTAIADAVAAILADPPLPSAVAATLAGRFNWERNGRELAEHLRRCAGRTGA